jgi:hypothetical protein
MKKQTWTLKHDAFCLEHKLPPTAKLLWQWLLANYKEDQDIEPDLETDFNSWAEKHRGKRFSINTIKNALKRLTECQVVRLIKKWSWYEVRIAIFPPNWFKPKLSKKSQNSDQIDEKQPSTSENSEESICNNNINNLEEYVSPEGIISEDDIAEYQQVLTECENAGVPFDPMKSPEILRYSIGEVKEAIALFEKSRKRQAIPNPQGWLICCLRFKWYEPYKKWDFPGLFAALAALIPGHDERLSKLIPGANPIPY